MQNADFLQSDLFRGAGFSHAFFTRSGGVSSGPFESLNFSVSVGDAPQKVEENLQRAARALAVNRSQLYFASQVHGRDVYHASGEETPEQVLEVRADAIVSRTQGVACSVRTADCLPVLFADLDSGMVAAAHAGWRGLVRRVLGATVQRLLADGCQVHRILAALGPHISVKAFEVSPEVAAEIQAASPDVQIVSSAFGPRPHCDLRKLAQAQLLEMGLRLEHIDDVLGCTFSDTHQFFSYRRDGKTSGRHLSAIVPRG